MAGPNSGCVLFANGGTLRRRGTDTCFLPPRFHTAGYAVVARSPSSNPPTRSSLGLAWPASPAVCGFDENAENKKPAGFHLAGFVGRTVPEQMSHILSCFSKTACRTFSRATYTERPTHDHNEVCESI